MRLLLDTHGLIWYSVGDAGLPETIRLMIDDPDNEVVVSLASVWEMAIKEGKGRLGLKSGPAAIVQNALRLGLRLLPIELSHVLAVQHLPPYHGDPFDRLLVAQAQIEGLTLASRDPLLDRYEVVRVW